MSNIKPFRGYIPLAKFTSQVASLPYDVLSSDEARVMASSNSYSFLHVVKPEIDLPEGSKKEFIVQKGADNLNKLIADGIIVQSETPCFYVYRQKMGDIVQTGIVAGSSVVEYEKGLVKKHEFTRKAKEDERAAHVDTLNAHTGPAFLTYRHKDKIDSLISQITERAPYSDFTADDGIDHTFWVVDSEAECNQIIELFKDVPALYIADGHHRSAAAARVGAMRRERNPEHTGEEPYNHFLSVIFPDNQLYVMDYNRVLKTLNGLTVEEIIAKVGEKFELTKLEVSDPQDAKPEARGAFAMYIDGSWYKMTAKPEIISKDPVKSLDVSILQDNVLAPLFNIEDPRTSNDIDFIGGIRGLKELVKRCNKDCKVAFALYPTGMDQLMTIADADQVMPPKSTWFEPKLRSGMCVKRLSEK